MMDSVFVLLLVRGKFRRMRDYTPRVRALGDFLGAGVWGQGDPLEVGSKGEFVGGVLA